jgi:hypothetical protein
VSARASQYFTLFDGRTTAGDEHWTKAKSVWMWYD